MADPIDSPVMEQRRLGRSGLKVSRLGLGTMTWGRDTDEHEAAEQLSLFLEAGGTLLDTAAGYGDGESERVIGKYVRDIIRDQLWHHSVKNGLYQNFNFKLSIGFIC